MARNHYRSKFEERFAKWLRNRKIRFVYEPFKLEYFLEAKNSVCRVCGEEGVVAIRRWYIPDFYLPDYNLIVETKGKFTSKDRTKIKAVVENNPEENFFILFQRDNWLSKKRVSRYSDWCERNGIRYSVVSGSCVSLPDEVLER